MGRVRQRLEILRQANFEAERQCQRGQRVARALTQISARPASPRLHTGAAAFTVEKNIQILKSQCPNLCTRCTVNI